MRRKKGITQTFAQDVKAPKTGFQLCWDGGLAGFGLRVTAAGVRDEFANQRIACAQYACRHGIDRPDITAWKWPF